MPNGITCLYPRCPEHSEPRDSALKTGFFESRKPLAWILLRYFSATMVFPGWERRKI